MRSNPMRPIASGLDRDRIMRTRYRIDSYQRGYFVIDSFEQLFEATRPDFTPIYRRLAQLPTCAAGEIVAGDEVITRGTGEGWIDTPDA